jgi:uncharacterized damage-inducible protein DinB
VPVTIRHITFDCADPVRLAGFWGALTGNRPEPADVVGPDDDEVLIVDPRRLAPGLLFIRVPEPKVVKNRVHLDVQPDDTRDAAFDRVLELGGTLVADHRRPDGTGWITVADPEGNELCLERAAAERGEPGPAALPEREDTTVRLGDEAANLVGLLEWYRAGVAAKAAGASPRVATTSPIASGVTIAGLVNHLALVEDDWMHHRFAGHPEPEPWASAPWDEDRDWEFHSANQEALADVIARYEAACARSREATGGRSLDDVAVGARPGSEFNLRFALLHLIEETARHLGHLDIIRELLDGTTGE